jgi:hypothetical protein
MVRNNDRVLVFGSFTVLVTFITAFEKQQTCTSLHNNDCKDSDTAVKKHAKSNQPAICCAPPPALTNETRYARTLVLMGFKPARTCETVNLQRWG